MRKRQDYDNESIQSLKGADRVRLRPSVIFGSDGLEGCQHAFFEILSNSIDEAREGFGEEIHVLLKANGAIRIQDFGRGIPLDYNTGEERYNWELIYCELYAGSKYDNNKGETYEYSLGLNGLGACATQYASEYFDVEVTRDGHRYSLHFERGENIGGLQKEAVRSRQTGTIQEWKPDDTVFTQTAIPLEFYQDVLKKQAVVNAGIRFTVEDEASGFQAAYLYPEGIAAYVKELLSKDALSPVLYFEGEGEGKDQKHREAYRVRAQIALAFDSTAPLLAYYHNSSYLAYGGSPDRAARAAFVAEFDHAAKQMGKYRSGESKISFNDIKDSLILVISSFSTTTSYENQTKKAINNKFIQSFLNGLMREQMRVWFIENQTEAQRVIDQVLVNKRSRESAEKQRMAVKKKLMGQLDNMHNRVKNFVDCRSRDPEKRELYIVEGNSALGSVKMARDAEYQAVIPLRGKILNCLKASYTQIFSNDIITDLLKILGCGVEITGKLSKNKLPAFDMNRLRWEKVIICTDADVDGFHIRTMILAMIYRLTPALIDAGKIFIAESPLFEITHRYRGIEQSHFAYSEREKNEIVEGLKGGKVHLQRSKGLGENEPEMMWETTMNPESRHLIQVLPEDRHMMEDCFDLLLGDNLDGRKQYIEDFGSEYMDMLDVV